MPTHTCSDELKLLLAKNLADWHGLPACHLADLRSAGIEVGSDETTLVLGEGSEPAIRRNAKLAAYAETAGVWLRDDTILRIEIDFPELPAFPALLAALGAPAAKLDAYSRSTPQLIAKAEWVWPDRGIAMRVSGDGARATELIVFPSTTLEHYRAMLRVHEATREFRE